MKTMNMSKYERPEMRTCELETEFAFLRKSGLMLQVDQHESYGYDEEVPSTGVYWIDFDN